MNDEINIINPYRLKKMYYLNEKNKHFINKSRNIISNILINKNKKFLIICGPCSIHSIKETINYAKKLKKLILKYNDLLYIVMRVYLEKPRTSIGWKGFINDPYINNTYKIEKGLKKSRKLLIKLAEMEVPCATELLNPILYKYIYDLYSLYTIGARTIESQIHREIISLMNKIPVGFKNNTNGDIIPSVNSILSSKIPNTFININNKGKISILKSLGNKNSYIILRGGKNKPNYYLENILEYEKIIKNYNINSSFIIDCSHDNSNKIFKLQKDISLYIIKNKLKNNLNVSGIMLESNINESNQDYNKKPLKYGISITDACIGWKDTNKIINKIYFLIKNNKIII